MSQSACRRKESAAPAATTVKRPRGTGTAEARASAGCESRKKFERLTGRFYAKKGIRGRWEKPKAAGRNHFRSLGGMGKESGCMNLINLVEWTEIAGFSVKKMMKVADCSQGRPGKPKFDENAERISPSGAFCLQDGSALSLSPWEISTRATSFLMGTSSARALR